MEKGNFGQQESCGVIRTAVCVLKHMCVFGWGLLCSHMELKSRFLHLIKNDFITLFLARLALTKPCIHTGETMADQKCLALVSRLHMFFFLALIVCASACNKLTCSEVLLSVCC